MLVGEIVGRRHVDHHLENPCDIVDSAGTLCNAAVALKKEGATSVVAYVTHGVLSGGAVARVTASELEQLVITDTIQATEAVRVAAGRDQSATHFVVGLAPDGGRLPSKARQDVSEAIAFGLNVDCGLHDYLSEDPEMVNLADRYGVNIRDIRKPTPIKALHFFSGKIEAVKALKIAVLGTDSAVGKRTTAWLIVNALNDIGMQSEMIGTGQTAWMQGAKYAVIMDSLINDFVAGEIEHAVWKAWNEERPEVIVIEGQGSLMNPAYPGGFEILAAGRPDIIVLQHAPARKEYDGFPGYRIQPLAQQIEAIELLSAKPVVAVAINHENLTDEQIPLMCDAIEQAIGLPAFDVLKDGPEGLVNLLFTHLKNR